MASPRRTIHTTCCIAGGGPAGMMLGYILGRAGVDVVVLEKHADFLRDFRGDTLHPSTLEVMHELGLLDALLKLPHQEVPRISGTFEGRTFVAADFSRLPTRCKFIALMPQWDFLNFLVAQSAPFSNIRVLMQHQAVGLLQEHSRVYGLTANSPGGTVDIHADLVVAADGRHSTVRELSGLSVEDLGAPIDVLWMRISRKADDTGQGLGHIHGGRLVVLINRGEYFQCGLVIAKGGAEQIRAGGLPALQQTLSAIVPMLRDRVGELDDWDKVKLLSVQVNRLRQWYQPGLLSIGDAAHAMSPMGGVGINLAIQDAVAAANLLAAPLRERAVTERVLDNFQHRREWAVRLTQQAQVVGQARIFQGLAGGATTLKLPLALRWIPTGLLPRILGRAIGMGVRPEHVNRAIFVSSDTRPA